MNYIPSKEEIVNQNALIGEFVIRFEQISALIRFIILKICFPNFTKIQNNNIETLLEGLTSDPLRKKLEALVYDNFTDENDFKILNKKLSDKFSEMIPIRNSIAHGSMLLGWKSFDGELSADTFLLKHSKTTKKGIDRNSMIVNLHSIEILIKQIILIENAYSTLGVLINKDIPDKNKKLHMKNLKDKIDAIGKIQLDYEDKVNK